MRIYCSYHWSITVCSNEPLHYCVWCSVAEQCGVALLAPWRSSVLRCTCISVHALDLSKIASQGAEQPCKSSLVQYMCFALCQSCRQSDDAVHQMNTNNLLLSFDGLTDSHKTAKFKSINIYAHNYNFNQLRVQLVAIAVHFEEQVMALLMYL